MNIQAKEGSESSPLKASCEPTGAAEEINVSQVISFCHLMILCGLRRI